MKGTITNTNWSLWLCKKWRPEGRTTSAVLVINPIYAVSELEDSMEEFDNRVRYLNDKLKKLVKQLVEVGTLTEPKNFVVDKLMAP